MISIYETHNFEMKPTIMEGSGKQYWETVNEYSKQLHDYGISVIFGPEIPKL